MLKIERSTEGPQKEKAINRMESLRQKQLKFTNLKEKTLLIRLQKYLKFPKALSLTYGEGALGHG